MLNWKRERWLRMASMAMQSVKEDDNFPSNKGTNTKLLFNIDPPIWQLILCNPLTDEVLQ